LALPYKYIFLLGLCAVFNESGVKAGFEANFLVQDCQLKFNRPSTKGEICIDGTITKDVMEAVERIPERIETVIIRSGGGDVRSAIIVGMRLARDKSKLVVVEKCYSSCANYLVPAAAVTNVTKGAHIVLHGSLPRNFGEYIGTLNLKGNVEQAERRQIIVRYNNYRKDLLDLENKFFDDLAVDDGYLIRFRELARTADVTDRAQSGDGNKFALILDDLYLSSFRINATFEEEKPSYCGLKNKLSSAFPKSVLLYGFYGTPLQKMAAESFTFNLVCVSDSDYRQIKDGKIF
jgi:hypothetical protein